MVSFKVVLILMVMHASGEPPALQEYDYPNIEACVERVQSKLNEAAEINNGDTFVAACRVEPVDGKPA